MVTKQTREYETTRLLNPSLSCVMKGRSGKFLICPRTLRLVQRFAHLRVKLKAKAVNEDPV